MPSVPVLSLPRVYHVGTLDPALRGVLHRSSQEGPCLSVSLCPESWVGIARLGGSPLFALERDEAAFLDVLAALRDPELRDVIVRWAESEGLIALREQYKAWRYDDETEEWSHFLFDARQQAEAEVDEFADGPDGGPAVEPHMGHVATEELARRLGCGPVDSLFAIDFAAILWAREAAPHYLGRTLDGVWFAEDYAPERLSAPRGGIFPEILSAWTALPVVWADVDDEEYLEAMPEAVLFPLAGSATPAPSAI
ncbi:hypothetical protein ACFPYM_02535 [Methylobacterium hispanicum]|nr:hypothetical protein [Methylobacterium hispanicum]